MWLLTRPSFITDADLAELLANGHCTAGGEIIDHYPVVKLYTPDAGATWLLTELDPDDEDLAFGLCDLGLGFPEIGRVRLSELASVRGPYGLKIERDNTFKGEETLSVYAREARAAGRIIA